MPPRGRSADVVELKKLVQSGRMELRSSFKILRKLSGLSQREQASLAGVNAKVVAALESSGNVDLESLQRLAAIAGLRLALVASPAIELYSPDERALEKQVAREADLASVRAGRPRNELNARNALSLGSAKLKLRSLP